MKTLETLNHTTTQQHNCFSSENKDKHFATLLVLKMNKPENELNNIQNNQDNQDSIRVLYKFSVEYGDNRVESLFLSTRNKLNHALGHDVMHMPYFPCMSLDNVQEVTSDAEAISKIEHVLPIGDDLVELFFWKLNDEGLEYCACEKCANYLAIAHNTQNSQ